MLEQITSTNPSAYSIQVSGIRCVNCASKIKKGLTEGLAEPEAKIVVNIMQEKINLTVFKEQSVETAMRILKEIGFPPIGQPVAISGGDESYRTIAFLVNDNAQTKNLKEIIGGMLGVTRCSSSSMDGLVRINVGYNCEIIKGRQVSDTVQRADPRFIVVNDRIDSFSQGSSKLQDQKGVCCIILLSLYMLISNMLLPVLPFTKGLYEYIHMFPEAWGVCSLMVIINFVITLYVMIFRARHFIVRAFKNYVQFNVTNMETLIALGSLSAFALFLFFMVRYSIQYYHGSHAMVSMAIMDINEALTSASIIVLVVTIGNSFEKKVKRKIINLTQQIFPQSTLFEDMAVKCVEIKNRNLVILNEKKYDVSLIEKNDILRIQAGRTLVDSIVISGTVKARQSARTGCDDIVELGKGERLQSGAEIVEAKDCLVIVQNVLEKSLLIQIGTQIKLAQNQEQSEQSGIQALCKRIMSSFVKGVIFLSLFTIVVWSILLFFGNIDVKICDFCWIFERGIGVLVASCPCALGLAIPSVIAIILNLATKSGVLIKNNGIFEKIKKAKKIAFDKTGTLFTRINKIQDFKTLSNSYDQKKYWQIVAVIEKQIRHPLAEILYKVAFQKSQVVGTNYSFILLEKPKVQKEGITAKLLDKAQNKQMDVLIGNKNLLKAYEISVPKYQHNIEASTVLFLASNSQVLMAIHLNTHANIRPEAKDVVAKLKQEGLQVHILSGDSAESVNRLGEFLDIPYSCLHPQQSPLMKMSWIRENQQKGEHVIMIGDGLNDIPCLQEAGIGISINAKSQLNINAADVVILSQNLYKILALVRFIKKGNLFIKINLFWAFAYNIVVMPIVAGVFYHWDLVVSPVWSSIAMSASSLLVVGFSHLLSFFHYDDSNQQGSSNATNKASSTKASEITDSSRMLRDEMQVTKSDMMLKQRAN